MPTAEASETAMTTAIGSEPTPQRLRASVSTQMSPTVIPAQISLPRMLASLRLITPPPEDTDTFLHHTRREGRVVKARPAHSGSQAAKASARQATSCGNIYSSPGFVSATSQTTSMQTLPRKEPVPTHSHKGKSSAAKAASSSAVKARPSRVREGWVPSPTAASSSPRVGIRLREKWGGGAVAAPPPLHSPLWSAAVSLAAARRLSTRCARS